jgi:Ser/Thr protein kinase RdoA (MazF antagonist)
VTPAPFDELTEAGRARRLRPIVTAALSAWRLDVRRVRLVTNGFNGVFRVDAAEGAFVLRVNLPRRTDAELRAELAWLAALAEDGTVEVPRPVPTAEGRPWAVARAEGVPGPRRCVLFSWLPGRPIAPDDGPEAFARLGTALARLHAHAAGWRPPGGLTRGLKAWDRPFPAEPEVLFAQRSSPRVRAIWRDTMAATQEGLGRLWGSDQRPRPTHHDLHIDNVRLSRSRLAVIDFDDSMLAFPAQDLGVALFQDRMRGCPPTALRAIREGYERVAAWPDDRDVQTFVAAAAMDLTNAVYQDFDPGYRTAADRYAAGWATIAAEALRRL